MIGEWWWTYVVIVIAGWLAPDIWRWLGVATGARLNPDSEAPHWVRAVATALVLAVPAKLIVFPARTLAEAPLGLGLGERKSGGEGTGMDVLVSLGGHRLIK